MSANENTAVVEGKELVVSQNNGFNYFKDQPIESVECDVLNRGYMADSLVGIFTTYSGTSSFVVGLYGEWGSGKTSILNMAFEKLEQQEEQRASEDDKSTTVIMRFEPWLCSEPKQLVSEFFKQMANEVRIKEPLNVRISKLIVDWGDVLSNLTGFVDPVSSLLDISSLVTEKSVTGGLFQAASKFIGAGAKKYAENTLKNYDLKSAKEHIVQVLTKHNFRFIVTIDDIDRLSESEIIAIFQLVKSLADFPNTVYVLSFDYDVVVKALDKVQTGKGVDYLEKIVQLPISMPVVLKENIRAIFNEKLRGVLQDNFVKLSQDSSHRYGLLCNTMLSGYIINIRDVNRFINIFSIRYKLLLNEVNLVDLLGITCLEVFESQLHSGLFSYKEQLCLKEEQEQSAEKPQTSDSFKLEDGDYCQKARDLSLSLSILNLLFRNKDSSRYGCYWRDHNICVQECFDRYFSFVLSPRDITDAEFQCSIGRSDQDTALSTLNKIYLHTYLRYWVKAACDTFHPLNMFGQPQKELVKFLQIFHIWMGCDDGIAYGHYLCGSRFINELLVLISEQSEQQRFDCIRDVFKASKVQPGSLLHLCRFCLFFEPNQPIETIKEKLKPDQVDELKRIFIDKCNAAVDSGDALKYAGGLDFLSVLRAIDFEKFKYFKTKILNSDCAYAKVIYSVFVTTQGVYLESFKLPNQEFDFYFDCHEAYKRMKSFVYTDGFHHLVGVIQSAVIAFLLLMEEKQSALSDEAKSISYEQISLRLLKIQQDRARKIRGDGRQPSD